MTERQKKSRNGRNKRNLKSVKEGPNKKERLKEMMGIETDTALI